LSPSLFGVDAAFGVKNESKVRCFGPDPGVGAGFFILGRAGVFFSTILGGWIESVGERVGDGELWDSSMVVLRKLSIPRVGGRDLACVTAATRC
jgi:hypothetical protein